MGKSAYAKRPYALNLGPLGYIEGLTLQPSSTTTSSKASCHYIGGLPYALPPTGAYRFRRPRPLPTGYRYGTRANPGRFTGGTGVCPQPPFRILEPDTALWDEDCLQLNMWIPSKKPPKQGWPVFFYIHGGFLQFGTANMTVTALAPLMGDTDFEAIIVMPAYRLNAFGFLAGREMQAEAEMWGEVAGNLGFWDQRIALEWTAENIRYFGGDAANITIAGYSAGSHSVFHQLSHYLFHPVSKVTIRRAIMWSNGPGLQPKSLAEQEEQFDELLFCLAIPQSLSAAEKIAQLRSISAKKLVAVQDKMKLHEFRATSDGDFVNKDLFDRINDGTYARLMKQKGVKLMMGECSQEHFLYGAWRTPQTQSAAAVFDRLHADYPLEACKKLRQVYFPDARLPEGYKDWQDLFGRIYADVQIHCIERGFVDCLSRGGLKIGEDVLRYRIEWRAKCVDGAFPKEWGATHATDMAIWFWGGGMGEGLLKKEQDHVALWNKQLARFVKDLPVEWMGEGPRDVMRLNADAGTDVWHDDDWERGLRLWEAVNGTRQGPEKAKL
ncbi:hypothetical protein LTR50_001591 [Elasticomyces elasticus]|nr:hypothetical protein LTR50_001591 [Elasticomyces elasticus]